MVEYSGRMTAHEHKFDDWKEKDISEVNDCIQSVTLFDVQWSNCPVEVEKEVIRLWQDRELDNDHCYFKWGHKDDANEYPIIDEYLKSRGITKCLIHWWW